MNMKESWVIFMCFEIYSYNDGIISKSCVTNNSQEHLSSGSELGIYLQ